MQVQVETISTGEASKMLAGNAVNRKLSRLLVARYAHDMEQGAWRLNGEAIVVSKSGRLLDGQHRLSACIEAGVPLTAVVVRGAEDDVFATLDQGRARSIKDTLDMRGEVRTTALASALNILYRWELGWQEMEPHDKGHATRRISLTAADCAAVLGRHGGIRYSISLMDVQPYDAITGFLPFSVAGAMHYIFSSMAGAEVAEDFFKKLAIGANLEYGHPVLMLRNALLNIRATGTRGGYGGQYRRRWIIALVIKAWNAYVEGRTVGVIRWRGNEDFPQIAAGAPNGKAVSPA